MLNQISDVYELEQPDCGHKDSYLNSFLNANTGKYEVFWACCVCNSLGELHEIEEELLERIYNSEN